MEQGYILDTNVAIYFLQGRLPHQATLFLKEVLQRKARISVITKIELLSWEEYPPVSSDFVNRSDVFSLTEPVIKACIDIRKKYKTKLPDAIIAATSIVHGLRLITRNASDFKKIKELSWVNPFEE
jgi:toxin FitB